MNNKYVDFLDYVKPDGLSIDYDVDPLWARDNLKNVCLQGGLDPKLLLGDEKKLFYEVDKYLKIFKKTPYIFNLGHGLLPDTNPDVLNNIIKKGTFLQMTDEHPKVNYGKTGVLLINLGTPDLQNG